MLKNTLISLFFSFVVCFAFSQNKDCNIGEKYVIDSEMLGETREIWVSLPVNYDANIKYPTLYVLDAEWMFDLTYAIMKELAVNDKIPDHIVVGIPHIDAAHRIKDMTFTTNAINSDGIEDASIAAYFTEDLTCGGPQFLDFLSNEVVPLVDSLHLTNHFNVLIGHSLGGYFGAYTLALKSPFKAFQLYDPSIWYNSAGPVHHFSEKANRNESASVFIASANGGKERQQYNIDQHEKFHQLLLQHRINSGLKMYDEGHNAVRLPGLIDGLSGLYKGYSIGTILPTDTITVEDVKQHYTDFSNKVNFSFTAPAEVYRWVGFVNHVQGNWVSAVEAYDLCIDFYTDDLNVLLEYADCYYQLDAYELSLEVYQKALKIDPLKEITLARINEIEVLRNEERH